MTELEKSQKCSTCGGDLGDCSCEYWRRYLERKNLQQRKSKTEPDWNPFDDQSFLNGGY